MAKDLEILNNLRRLRFDAGEMTQQELARRAGISRQAVIAIESGKYSPSLELAFRLSLVFEKPIGEVFSCRVSDPGTTA